tara:strand:- start:244 stop:690 length:447 start_codon:yes stop_codon:yes gene_type:complete
MEKIMKHIHLILLSLTIFFTSLSAQDLITQEIDRLEKVFVKEAVKTNITMTTISLGGAIIGLSLLSDIDILYATEDDLDQIFTGLGFLAGSFLLPPLAAIKDRNVTSAEIAVRNEAKEFAKNNSNFFGIRKKAKKVARPIVTGIVTKF